MSVCAQRRRRTRDRRAASAWTSAEGGESPGVVADLVKLGEVRGELLRAIESSAVAGRPHLPRRRGIAGRLATNGRGTIVSGLRALESEDPISSAPTFPSLEVSTSKRRFHRSFRSANLAIVAVPSNFGVGHEHDARDAALAMVDRDEDVVAVTASPLDVPESSTALAAVMLKLPISSVSSHVIVPDHRFGGRDAEMPRSRLVDPPRRQKPSAWTSANGHPWCRRSRSPQRHAAAVRVATRDDQGRAESTARWRRRPLHRSGVLCRATLRTPWRPLGALGRRDAAATVRSARRVGSRRATPSRAAVDARRRRADCEGD